MRGRASALAPALAAVALLAACGGGGNADGATAPQQTAAAGTAGSAGSAGGASSQPRAAAAPRLVRIGRFDSPTYLTAPPADKHRLFVVEQPGTIRVVRNGRKLARPFLDLRSDVLAGGERGLLSMAFAPGYASSRLFYVYFTGRDGDIHIQEFRAAKGNPDVADPSSRRELMRIEHSEFANHNGGQLQFGPDGLLYAGVGDGGSEGDPRRYGQNRSVPYAKILRLDPARRGGTPEFYAYGLRNPWRFSFDRKTGDLVIADVGQDAIEEVDFAPRGTGKGRNYGWSVFEGKSRYHSGSAPGAVAPVIQRFHSRGACSITGGYVVRDRSLGSLYGRYVYGDLCDPALRSARLRPGRAEGDRKIGLRVPSLSSFGEDARARVYALSLEGPVYRLSR